MKKQIGKWLTILIPLLIGIGIIYYQFTTLTSDEIEKIKISFEKANYYYILLSLVIACIGYWSRAYRWKYAIEHLGYTSHFYNNLMAVCIAYFMNLSIPRSGEVSRALVLKKYENVPFDKALGTIVAERIVDFIIFLLFNFDFETSLSATDHFISVIQLLHWIFYIFFATNKPYSLKSLIGDNANKGR